MNQKFNFKNNTDVKNNNLKLTNEEINSVDGFAFSTKETEALGDFIYNISIILYKTNENEKS
jgi:hypothetical protein